MSARHLALGLALLGLLFEEVPAAVRTAPMTSRAPSSISDNRWPGGRPLRLCALRVEFREDTETGTSGNGLMESAFDTTLVLDPLPHDSLYFADHLTFLRNYYETVSKGKVHFPDTLPVFPAGGHAAYRLDYPMWHYNHNTGDADLNRGLVELYVDAVQKAALDPAIDFHQYDAIIVFHAGVGKDFNLGFDATPFDIPSAYINENDLAGQPIPNGVGPGLILPEAENQREALDLGIELSMNGIMIKLFGNWLGLPDLFNTQTGQSGVGRWGMMDQGSGNVDALVPALPDAWSRVYMRWETPVEDSLTGSGDTVSVARFGESDTVQVIKLPITPREYYLIENRSADKDSGYQAIPDTAAYVELLDRNNRRLQVYRDGRMAREEGFRVAVRVRDNRYDFGIPGNGILIWHIDEDVIERGLPTNSVNTDRNHRGVDLVEADGAQDIGMEYGFASAGSGTELGVPEDAWYKDNGPYRDANRNAPVVRFADETFPSARLYDGSYPHLEVRGFSDPAPVMRCVVRATRVVSGFPVAFPQPAEWTIADLDGNGRPEVYFAANDSLYKADSLGQLSAVALLPPGLHLAAFNPPVHYPGDSADVILLQGNRVGIIRRTGGVDSVRYTDLLPFTNTRVYPAKTDSSNAPRILAVITDSSQALTAVFASQYDLHLNAMAATQRVTQGTQVAPVPYNLESFPARRFVFVSRDESNGAASGEAQCLEVADSAFLWPWRRNEPGIQPEAIVLVEPETTSVYLRGYGYVNAKDGATLCLQANCGAPDVDWNGDGIPDSGGRFHLSEIPREDAPHITADTSWVIDVDANGNPDLVGLANREPAESGSTVYTRVVTAAHSGGAFPGFPFAASVFNAAKPFRWTRNADNALHFMSTLNANGKYYYSVVRLADARRNGDRFAYTEDNAIINVGALRPQVNARSQWVYCWPNPTSDVSRIRITLPYAVDDAEVKIFDLAGRKVATLHGSSTAPGPLAFEIPWNVSGVESGVYIGRVKVRGNGGSQESQIKIAVVK